MIHRLLIAIALLLLPAPGEAYHTALAPAVRHRVGAAIHMGGKKAKYGLFSPLVQAGRAVMGDQELLQLRAKVIQAHSKVIAKFVDTSDSKFGQIALRKLFEAADVNSSGDLDREEVKKALEALGFSVDDKAVDGIVGRADVDGNEVIDFEEFVKDAPKTLRVQLVKLAKQNGDDLGFLI